MVQSSMYIYMSTQQNVHRSDTERDSQQFCFAYVNACVSECVPIGYMRVL